MDHELTQRALLGLVVLVFVAAVVIVAGPGITANVVQGDACNCLPTKPVCAVANGTAFDFASACDAQCSDARVISEGYCSQASNKK